MKLLVKNISKHIGKKEILKDISIELESGKVYGFVGKNGSGKTMLFRALSGLMDISSGKIFLDNKELHKDMRVLENVGIVIENAGLYPELTGFNNLNRNQYFLYLSDYLLNLFCYYEKEKLNLQ